MIITLEGMEFKMKDLELYASEFQEIFGIKLQIAVDIPNERVVFTDWGENNGI
jgi:hypothetical protein